MIQPRITPCIGIVPMNDGTVKRMPYLLVSDESRDHTFQARFVILDGESKIHYSVDMYDATDKQMNGSVYGKAIKKAVDLLGNLPWQYLRQPDIAEPKPGVETCQIYRRMQDILSAEFPG